MDSVQIKNDTNQTTARENVDSTMDNTGSQETSCYAVGRGTPGHWMQDQKLDKKGLSAVDLTSEMASPGDKDPS